MMLQELKDGNKANAWARRPVGRETAVINLLSSSKELKIGPLLLPKIVVMLLSES